jgi:hypothetical protein
MTHEARPRPIHDWAGSRLRKLAGDDNDNGRAATGARSRASNGTRIFGMFGVFGTFGVFGMLHASASRIVDRRGLVPALALMLWLAAPVTPVRAQSADATWVITGATLIDGTGAAPIVDARIVGRGDRIVCAGRAAECAVPDGATMVNAAGKWAIPGLIDTHVHLEWRPHADPRTDARTAQLIRFALGITTTRDAGTAGQLERTLAARGRAAAPDVPEPRLVVSGLVSFAEKEPDVPAAAAAADVRRLVGLGVDAIKLKREFSAAALQAITRDAHASGLPVFGHTWGPQGSFLAAALDAGIDGVSHMYSFSEFANRHDPARPPAPEGLAFWVWVEELWHYQDEPRLRALTERLLRQHVWLEPLLVTEKHFTLPYPVPEDVAYLGEVRSAEQILRSWLPIGDSGWRRRRERQQRIEAVYARQCEVVQEFHQRGGLIVTGADESPAGLALLEEVSLLAGCGFTPMAAIQAATRDSAAALGLRDTGTIEPGKRADLVLLAADPLADLANLRHPWRVVKGGHVHDPATLLQPIVSSYARETQQAWSLRAATAALAIAVAAGLFTVLRKTRRRRRAA